VRSLQVHGVHLPNNHIVSVGHIIGHPVRGWVAFYFGGFRRGNQRKRSVSLRVVLAIKQTGGSGTHTHDGGAMMTVCLRD
jgi:hypothetical protein